MGRQVLVVLVIILLGILAWQFLSMPDRRTTTEKIGDAIHDLPQGTDKAAQQLEDRTPGQKLGDTIKDNTQSH